MARAVTAGIPGRARTLARPGRTFASIVLAGMVLRIILAFSTTGNVFDLESFRLVRDNLLHDPLGVYHLDYDVGWQRWPYPAGFFPFVIIADGAARVLGVPFVDLLRVVLGLGDVALAWITWAFLRGRTNEQRALVAAALIMFGPSFFVISGVHGQLDAFAWAPAIAAFAIWETPRHATERAVLCGALIGIGIAFKTVPGLMLLALLPSARSWREAIRMTVIAGVIPLLSLVPFAIGDAHGVRQLTGYHGVPGIGGVSLLVQPDFAVQWLQLGDQSGSLHANRLNEILLNHGGLLTGLAVLGVFGILALRRAPAATASLVLVLALWVFGFNFLIAYAVWGLAILLITDRLRAAALLQLGMLVPTALVYIGREANAKLPEAVAYGIYFPIMMGLLAVFAIWLWRLLYGREHVRDDVRRLRSLLRRARLSPKLDVDPVDQRGA